MEPESEPVDLPVGEPVELPVRYPPGKHPNQIKHHKKGKAAVEEARVRAAEAEKEAQSAAVAEGEEIDFDAPEVLKAMHRVMLTEKGQDRTSLHRALRKLYDSDFAKFMDLYNRREAAEEKRSVGLLQDTGPDPGALKARALIQELLDSFYQKHPEIKRP
jgi:hypothetical protein